MGSLDLSSLGPTPESILDDSVLIYFKVAFNQAFLKSAGNLVTSTKFLGFGMKCATYEPDSPKADNRLFNMLTTFLKTLCKTLPILFADSYSHFHSLCDCLMR